jgi:mannose-6-phosphate isomerase-like protein (cupin superfamily)
VTEQSTPIVLPPDGGRTYACGPLLTAIFKADEDETGARYSVSEWRMQPGFEGVGDHAHEANDEIFWVLEGRPELLVGDEWRAAGRGTFLRIPAGVTHNFRNRSDAPAILLNVFIPGGFERDMPAIADWFARNG